MLKKWQKHLHISLKVSYLDFKLDIRKIDFLQNFCNFCMQMHIKISKKLSKLHETIIFECFGQFQENYFFFTFFAMYSPLMKKCCKKSCNRSGSFFHSAIRLNTKKKMFLFKFVIMKSNVK